MEKFFYLKFPFMMIFCCKKTNLQTLEENSRPGRHFWRTDLFAKLLSLVFFRSGKSFDDCHLLKGGSKQIANTCRYTRGNSFRAKSVSLTFCRLIGGVGHHIAVVKIFADDWTICGQVKLLRCTPKWIGKRPNSVCTGSSLLQVDSSYEMDIIHASVSGSYRLPG